MRQIGHLQQESDARVFHDFLYVQDIENDVEADGEQWVIWVHDEEQLQRAQALLDEFRRNPADPRYRASQEAERKRARQQEDQKKAQRRFFDRTRLFPERFYRLGVVSVVLMGLSVIVTLVTAFGRGESFPKWFAMANFVVDGSFIRYTSLTQVLQDGEVWRLFTPVFVHMNWLHLLFNLLWLKDLGSLVEQRLGPWKFLALVALIAALPNIGEFLANGPRFGGMSGVVYGLFGYIWIRNRFDPGGGFFLDPTTITIVLAWYFLCLLGVIPNVANVVHTVGLGLGMLAGFLSALTARRR